MIHDLATVTDLRFDLAGGRANTLAAACHRNDCGSQVQLPRCAPNDKNGRHPERSEGSALRLRTSDATTNARPHSTSSGSIVHGVIRLLANTLFTRIATAAATAPSNSPRPAPVAGGPFEARST